MSLPGENVFMESTDADLSSSLNERISEIASASGDSEDETPELVEGMTGTESNSFKAGQLYRTSIYVE